MEAQWSPQWPLNGRYWSAKGDTVVVQGRQKHRINWYTMFTTVQIILWGDQWQTHVHPFCDHGNARLFLLHPVDDLWVTDILGKFCATVLNMLKTSRRPWRPWRGLAVLCATLERPKQPFCLLCAFNGDLASFMVARGRHKGRSPCVHVGKYNYETGLLVSGEWQRAPIDDTSILVLIVCHYLGQSWPKPLSCMAKWATAS